MKLNQEELFLLSQIYEKGMGKKSVIEELSSMDEEGDFLKNLINKIQDLSEEELKNLIVKEIQLLNFNLEDLIK